VIVLFIPICVMPFLDRIDIHIEVPRVDYNKLTDERLRERSEAIRARVERARKMQRQRFANTSLRCNADMGPTEVRGVCRLDEAGQGLVKAAMQQLRMSARAFHRILKLARTIADLAGSERRLPPGSPRLHSHIRGGC
jgi:magnesium chelatase family protein